MREVSPPTEGQAETLPDETLITDSGDVARSVGAEERTIETESGEVRAST